KLESHLVDNANDAQAKPAADNALLKAHLNGIIKACAKFSKKSAQIHLDGLAKMTHAPSIRHGIDKISINMLHGDFDEAANTAKSLFPQ
ncbi:MAG: hypothetical protein FWB71_03125, partial [Defluviitaleaceae bacterium]|nr:hypothetical protein [Defluviitaleaceae bacterium]